MSVSQEFLNWLKPQVKPVEGYTQEETFQAITETAAKEYNIECYCNCCGDLTPINHYNENDELCDKCNHSLKFFGCLNFFKKNRFVLENKNIKYKVDYLFRNQEIKCPICKISTVCRWNCICCNCYFNVNSYDDTLKHYMRKHNHISYSFFKEKLSVLESFYENKS